MKFILMKNQLLFLLFAFLGSINAMEDPAYKGPKRPAEYSLAGHSGSPSQDTVAPTFLPVKRSRTAPQTLQSAVENRIEAMVALSPETLDLLIKKKSLPLNTSILFLNYIFGKHTIQLQDPTDKTCSELNCSLDGEPQINLFKTQEGEIICESQQFYLPFVTEALLEVYHKILLNNPKTFLLVAAVIDKLKQTTIDTLKTDTQLVNSLPVFIINYIKKHFLTYMERLTKIYEHTIPYEKNIVCFADPTSGILLRGYPDGSVVVNIPNQEVQQFKFSEAEITYLGLNDTRQGKIITIGNVTGEVYLIVLNTLQKVKLNGHESTVVSTEVIDDTLITLGADDIVRIWDLTAQKNTHTFSINFDNQEYPQENLTISIIDNNRIALNEIDGVKIYNIHSGTCETVLNEPHCQSILPLNSDTLAILGYDDNDIVNIWDLTSGKKVYSLRVNTDPEETPEDDKTYHIIREILKIDSTLIITSQYDDDDADYTITFWDIPSKKIKEIVEGTHDIKAAFIVNQKLVVISARGIVSYFDPSGVALFEYNIFPDLQSEDYKTVSGNQNGVITRNRISVDEEQTTPPTLHYTWWKSAPSFEDILRIIAEDNAQKIAQEAEKTTKEIDTINSYFNEDAF